MIWDALYIHALQEYSCLMFIREIYLITLLSCPELGSSSFLLNKDKLVIDLLFRKFDLLQFTSSGSGVSLHTPNGVFISPPDPLSTFRLSPFRRNRRVKLLRFPVFRVKVEVGGRSGTLKEPENFRCFERFGSDRFCRGGGTGFSGIRVCDADFFIPNPVSTLGLTFFRSGLFFLLSSKNLEESLISSGLREELDPPFSLADE